MIIIEDLKKKEKKNKAKQRKRLGILRGREL